MPNEPGGVRRQANCPRTVAKHQIADQQHVMIAERTHGDIACCPRTDARSGDQIRGECVRAPAVYRQISAGNGCGRTADRCGPPARPGHR